MDRFIAKERSENAHGSLSLLNVRGRALELRKILSDLVPFRSMQGFARQYLLACPGGYLAGSNLHVLKPLAISLGFRQHRLDLKRHSTH